MSTRSNPWFDPWKDLAHAQPWQSTLEDWWSQFSRQPASPVMQAFENIVAQGRSFFRMAEELGKSAMPQDAAADWQGALDQIFGNLKKTFESPDAKEAQNLFWQMPLANWQRTVSSLSSLPGDLFAAAPHGFDPNAKLDQFLSTPGVGYAREFQGEQQKLARLVLDYQEAYRKYVAVFAEVGKQSLDCMRDRLVARMSEGQQPITGTRELYNLWVDCSEEVYGSHVMTDEYARLHGEMVNALMALKHQVAVMTDDIAGSLNMPTRREMDTIHQRFQSARRCEKSLKRELDELRTAGADTSQQLQEVLARIGRLEAEGGVRKSTKEKKAKKPRGKAKKKSGKKKKTSKTGGKRAAGKA